MKKLQKDWLTQGLIDFEYKKFVVLAYLQHVQRHFSDKKFYPDLPELREHYESGLRFQNHKGKLSASFPKDATGINPESLTVRYQPRQEDDELMTEIDSIINFALPQFGQMLTKGQQMVEELEAALTLTPIGMLPLRRNEGYLFLHWTSHAQTHIYYFTVNWPGLALPGLTLSQSQTIRTRYIDSVRKGIGTTYETLKLELIRQRPYLPNPATYMVESKRRLPLEETLLPMAGRLVERQALE
ncbi:hypothetical protein LX87_01466 [Larkinella arboricola]|uniref:Uncharacterized protein n=1 Tax=Larkinella arboricola TaxID=643671 RepID=A0A327X000_LARAB|nr:hypothetical protein [Larkinella arboricola]RAJ99770.1 hypothetical protein LX87_01466 [Larkinella arboricola]